MRGKHKIAAVCTVTAVALAPVVVAAQSASASSAVTMSVSKPTLVVGTKEHFSGHVSGRSTRIVLQRGKGSDWKSLAVHHTDSNGSYRFAFIPVAPGHITFRVAATTPKGAITGTSATSRVTVLEWHYLSDLQIVSGSFYCTDLGPVEINGANYLHSVFTNCGITHAGDSGSLDYNLARKCKTFNATLGLRDDSDPNVAVTLTVAADGATLRSADEALGEATSVTTNISGHLRLTIGYVLGTDESNSHNGLHPAFGNARILCAF